MKANIIKDGQYKGMKFTTGLVYSVSEPTYAQLVSLGIAVDERPKVTIEAEEIKEPKKKGGRPKKVTKEQKFEEEVPNEINETDEAGNEI